MQIKQFLISLGIAAALTTGIGVGTVAGVKGQVKETDAATTETTFYIGVTGATWSGNAGETRVYLYGGSEYNDGNSNRTDTYIWPEGSNDGHGSLGSVVVEGVTYYTFTMTDRDYTGGVIYAWNMNGKGNQTNDFSFATATTKQNLLTVTSNGGWDYKNNVAWGRLDVGTTHTITKMAVEFVNGVAQSPADWSLGSDVVSDGDTYDVPDSVLKNLEHFGGWFTNPACTVSYTSQTIEDDLTLYAKYSRLSVDSYIYYVTGSSSATTNYVYFGGEYAPASWPGTAVTSVSGVSVVTGTDTQVIKFEGTAQYVYKIPVPSGTSNTFVIFNVGSNSSQTGNLPLVAGRAYWFTKDSTTSYSDNAGAALDLIISTETKRNAVSDWGDSNLDYSICGVSASNAATLWNTYYALNDDTKAMLYNTTVHTYDPNDWTSEISIRYSEIMTTLKDIATKGGQSVDGSRIIGFGTKNNSATMIAIVLISSISLIAVGGFFFVRKKKAQ